MSTLADKLTLLRSRAAEIGSELSRLADRRKEHSLAASEGDKVALKEISDADFQSDALRKTAATVNSAIESANALLRQQQLETEQKQQRERENEAARSAEGVITLNAEIDQMLQQLREAFERRAVLLQGLGNSGLIDWVMVNRLASKVSATSAACHFGLTRFLNLERTPAHVMSPLSEGNVVLSGLAKKASPPRVSRLTNKVAAS
jgi:hypothetical protein